MWGIKIIIETTNFPVYFSITSRSSFILSFYIISYTNILFESNRNKNSEKLNGMDINSIEWHRVRIFFFCSTNSIAFCFHIKCIQTFAHSLNLTETKTEIKCASATNMFHLCKLVFFSFSQKIFSIFNDVIIGAV